MSSEFFSNNENIERSEGAVEVIAEDALARAQKLLAGFSGGWQKAVGSALARAASAGRTIAAREASKEYTITQQVFQSETRTVNHYLRAEDGAIEVVFGYRGNVIPLIRFDTRIGRDGRIEVRGKRKSSRAILDHAFVAKMGTHTGVYERTTAARFPVDELFGPSTPQLVDSESVRDRMAERMVETFDKRIDHEINVILNGWRR